MSTQLSKESKDLLKQWRDRFHISEQGHYESANSCRIFHYILGVPLVIVTTITASEVYNVMVKNGSNAIPVKFDDFDATISFLVICALLAPVLAALQSFLRFPERAEQHREAAVNFGLLKKEVERLLAFPPEPVELKARVEELQKRDVQIMKGVPTIGSLSRKKARRILAQRDPALVRFIRRLTFNILP